MNEASEAARSESEPQTAPPLPEGLQAFLLALERDFEPRRGELLAARARALALAHAGRLPGYRTGSEAQRGAWRIELPPWARDQRNQITGPADNAKLLIGMLNSGAPGCMPDGEDSITTDWRNVRAAQQNTVAAIEERLSAVHPETGARLAVRPSAQTVFYRPRGLAMSETRAIAGRALSASLFDLGAVFFQTRERRKAAGSDAALSAKLCFYVPKVESAEEAGWFSDLLAAMEAACGVPAGSTKIMFLIESLPAAYQAEEILHAARRHAIGLNLGRWDYMASLLHFKLADPEWILPDRNTIPHDIAFFQNIRYRIVDVCHRRGALAVGGMTALFPDRKDAQVNQRAMERLAADKRNEAAIGFDGAWTGHPDQQPGAIAQFPEPNQLSVTHPDAPREPDLTPRPAGAGRVTLAGTRDAVRTVIEYRLGVLSGLGARLIKGYAPDGSLIGGFMEDLATDRIYRLMLAQRVRHAVATEEGPRVDGALLARLFDEELAKLLEAAPPSEDARQRCRKARESSERMIAQSEF
ncbi:MAG: hypothetical protein HY554_17250 [Elusimicrobia bacterium]|nr:hypothetical protein [Elusimicrobiota bacterium]